MHHHFSKIQRRRPRRQIPKLCLREFAIDVPNFGGRGGPRFEFVFDQPFVVARQFHPPARCPPVLLRKRLKAVELYQSIGL